MIFLKLFWIALINALWFNFIPLYPIYFSKIRENIDWKYLNLTLTQEFEAFDIDKSLLMLLNNDLKNNIKEISIYNENSGVDEEFLAEFTIWLLNNFNKLNVSELILNGFSNKWLLKIIQNESSNLIDNLWFLRLEGSEYFSLDILSWHEFKSLVTIILTLNRKLYHFMAINSQREHPVI